MLLFFTLYCLFQHLHRISHIKCIDFHSNCLNLHCQWMNLRRKCVKYSWSTSMYAIAFCVIFWKHYVARKNINYDSWKPYILGKVANFATLTDGYNKDEIARAKDGDFLTVNVSLKIISFLEVDEIYCI